MIAADTNVLVRYVTNDDPVQARKAADLLAGQETILIAHSVLLEVEWVLRAVYELPRPAILKAMRQILGLPSTHVDQAALIAETLDRYGRGFDFADALHLALTAAASPFVTFDKRLVRAAEGQRPLVELL
jgi:predicted nucleic-acid-binding protein